MELELKEKSTMSREAAADAYTKSRTSCFGQSHRARARPGEVRGGGPDEVTLKVEFEMEDEETDREIELTW